MQNETEIYSTIISDINSYSMDVKMLSKMHSYIRNVTDADVNEYNENLYDKKSRHKDNETINSKNKDRFFIPHEQDHLFWCYYIFANGHDKYEMTETSKFSVEKAEKLACIDLLRQNKKQLSPFRIKGLKDTVEDDLVNSKKISLKTFIALCIVSNMNIMYVHNRKYYEIKCDPDDKNKVFVIHQFDTPVLRYGYEQDISPEILEKYRTEKYCSHSIDNPLKAVSSYKVGELRDICSLLGIESSEIEKKTKPHLYQMILEMLA